MSFQTRCLHRKPGTGNQRACAPTLVRSGTRTCRGRDMSARPPPARIQPGRDRKPPDRHQPPDARAAERRLSEETSPARRKRPLFSTSPARRVPAPSLAPDTTALSAQERLEPARAWPHTKSNSPPACSRRIVGSGAAIHRRVHHLRPTQRRRWWCHRRDAQQVLVLGGVLRLGHEHGGRAQGAGGAGLDQEACAAALPAKRAPLSIAALATPTPALALHMG